DQSGAVAADPGCPRDQLPAHPDLEGIHRPGQGRQVGPDGVRNQPLPGPLLRLDQFGPLSIRPCHGVCWAPRKQPARLRATSHRARDIRYFHGCYSVGDDQLWGITCERKGADHTLAALKSIRATRPSGYRLLAIWDNLSANKTLAVRRWATLENVELCFMPAITGTRRPSPTASPSCPPKTRSMSTGSGFPRPVPGSRRTTAWHGSTAAAGRTLRREG